MATAHGFNEGFSTFTEFTCQALPGPAMTDRARKVMALAEGRAKSAGSNRVGPEHLLFALAEEGSGVAANVLKNLGIGTPEIAEITAGIGTGEAHAGGEIAWSAATWRALACAEQEAKKLEHHYIGTEHLLLGVCRAAEGPMPGVFARWGTSGDQICSEVYSLLGHGA